MEFKDLNLDERLQTCLAEQGFIKPSPVQEQAIPLLKKNGSALIKAPTGSGKTLAYLIPILNDLETNRTTQAVILVPTGILAKQVEKTLRLFTPSYKDFLVSVISDGEVKKEKYDDEIIISTPDQFLFAQSRLNLKFVKRLIIDEGDMILFGGFEEQMNQILSLDLKWSKVLFTASVDEHLNRLVRRFIGAEHLIDLSEEGINNANITHYLVDIRHVEKPQALISFMRALQPFKCMIFVSKKEELKDISLALENAKIPFVSIYGELTKREQKRNYRLFDENQVMVLLATDLAARGVDLKDVSDVISLDLPMDILYYYHRAGRGGRFDKKGNSYVFYNNDDTAKVKELLRRGVPFNFLSLKGNTLKKERNLAVIERKPERNNEYVEKAIKDRLRKLRGNKVKPNYKKKRRIAIKLVKQYHKEDIIRKNLLARNEKEGTSFSFVSKDRYHGKRKKRG